MGAAQLETPEMCEACSEAHEQRQELRETSQITRLLDSPQADSKRASVYNFPRGQREADEIGSVPCGIQLEMCSSAGKTCAMLHAQKHAVFNMISCLTRCSQCQLPRFEPRVNVPRS